MIKQDGCGTIRSQKDGRADDGRGHGGGLRADVHRGENRGLFRILQTWRRGSVRFVNVETKILQQKMKILRLKHDFGATRYEGDAAYTRRSSQSASPVGTPSGGGDKAFAAASAADLMAQCGAGETETETVSTRETEFEVRIQPPNFPPRRCTAICRGFNGTAQHLCLRFICVCLQELDDDSDDEFESVGGGGASAWQGQGRGFEEEDDDYYGNVKFYATNTETNNTVKSHEK